MSAEPETQDAASIDRAVATASQDSSQKPLSTETTSTPISGLAAGARAWPGNALALVPVLATLALLGVLSFRGGGYLFVQAGPWVLGWLVVMLAWVVVARPPQRLPVPLAVAMGALGLLAVWTGLSIIWSVGPDLSWIAFDYALLYLAIGVLLSLSPVTRLGLRVATYGYLVVALVIAVYALLGKVLPESVTYAHQYARLLAPVGYWNVLALMLVMAAPVALALAARRTTPSWLRAAAASAAVLLLITLFFTFSRGGFLSLGLAVVVYFAAARERLSSLVSLAVVSVCTVVPMLALRHLETLFQSVKDLMAATTYPSDAAAAHAQHALVALRTSQGHQLGLWVLVAIVAAFAVQLLVALLHRRLNVRPVVVRWVGVAVLVVVVAAAVGVPVAYMERKGGVTTWVSSHYHAFITSNPVESGDAASRLTVISSNGRVDLYRTALRQVPHSRLLGTGAGTFAFTNYRYRTAPLVVKHAHSQWFNELSELGFPGLILFFVFAAGVVVAVVWRLVRLRKDPERGLMAAAAAGSFAFLFHISGDWDWDMAAITVAFFVLAVAACAYRGVETAGAKVGQSAAAAESRSGRRLPWPAVVAVAGALLLACAAWAVPWLSERAENSAHDALIAGRFAVAASDARRAVSLNPLAVDPLVTLSLAQEGRGLMPEAASALYKAIDMQPENWWLYYQMGLLQLKLGNQAAAMAQFRMAQRLDPLEARIATQLKLLGAG